MSERIWKAPSGRTYRIETQPLAYLGKEDCEEGSCRVMPKPDGGYRCIGWHCSFCDAPCSDQGHFDCPARKEGLTHG